MTNNATDAAAARVGEFLRLQYQIQLLRTYAATGQIPLGDLPTPLDNGVLRDFLDTAVGLATTQRWSRSFARTFASLDAAAVQAASGIQFDLDSWDRGLDAQRRCLTSLETHLRSRLKTEVLVF